MTTEMYTLSSQKKWFCVTEQRHEMHHPVLTALHRRPQLLAESLGNVSATSRIQKSSGLTFDGCGPLATKDGSLLSLNSVLQTHH